MPPKPKIKSEPYLTDLTQEYLKSILQYNSDTGLWYWLANKYQPKLVGTQAGTITDKGYINITIKTKKYKAHRLAFLYMTGEWPEIDVDHENTIKHDNRWINLRQAEVAQNNYNYGVKITNQLETKGVYLYRGRFRAQIQIDKVKIFLGSFGTLDEAKKAHDDAAIKFQGEFVHNSIASEN